MAIGLTTYPDQPPSLISHQTMTLESIVKAFLENSNMTPEEIKDLLAPEKKLTCPFCAQQFDGISTFMPHVASHKTTDPGGRAPKRPPKVIKINKDLSDMLDNMSKTDA